MAGPTNGRAARAPAYQDSLVRCASPAACSVLLGPDGASCSPTALHDSAAEAWHDHGLIVTTRYGEPVDPRNFHRAFKARCARAGVPEITLHAARHTCASLLVAMDVHPRVAMQILRHSRIAVTMNVYSEVSTEDTREALRRLGEPLSGEAS
jgi:integrase